MKCFQAALLLLLAIYSAVAQIPNPKILDVDGYPISWLRDPQPGTPFAVNDGVPTPVPLRPLSMRIMYRMPQDPTGNGQTGTPDPLVIRGAGFNSVANNGVTVLVKLIDPTATSCTGTGWFVQTTPVAALIQSEFVATVQLPFPANLPGFSNVPYTPHEFMMPWVCVCVTANQNPNVECGSTTGTKWVHTNMRYAPVQGCDGDNQNLFSSQQLIGTYDPNRWCYAPSSLIPPIVARAEYGENWNWIPEMTNNQPTVWDVVRNASVNSRLYVERRLRTQCCGWRGPNQQDPNNPSKTLRLRFGFCINPNLESCCARVTTSSQTGLHLNLTGAIGGIGKPYSRYREKCCYGGMYDSTADPVNGPNIEPPQPVVTSYLDDWCPCRASQVQTMCNQVQPASLATYGCCINTKYPEILYSASAGALTLSTPSANGLYLNQLWGKCYDGTTMKCCNTGDLYDPGSKQCCSINGVQSINVPCPCSSDSHCGTNQTCCQDLTARMMFPSPATFDNINLCNKYVNYPNGTGPYSVQPCIGQCIDTRYQICCNGMACIDAFELCCNSTCCNKFNQRCAIGLRPGARYSVYNRNDFHVYYEVCTSTEGMTPFRATLAYFLPLCLLAATFISLFSLLNFAKRQSSLQPLSIYEYTVFALSFVSVLIAWPYFFTTQYKYAVVWIWVQFFVMLAALSQLRLVNIGAVVMLGFLLNYVIDPFYGNEILTLASSRVPPPYDSVFGFSGVTYSNLLQAPAGYLQCTQWYDYFARDPMVEDQLRWDNPIKLTYGFCARGWIETVAILTGLNIVITFIEFFVMLVTHLRNVLFEKAQKTDDIVQQPWYG